MVREANNPHRPRLAISMGDPLGIGPEVLVKALADRALRDRARFVIHGFSGAMLAAADKAGIDPFWWRVRKASGKEASASDHDVVLIDAEPESDGSFEPKPARAEPTRAGGLASFTFVEDAITAAKGEGPIPADGIVTAPISKAAWALAGKGKYPGHTELLTTRFKAKRTRMMFDSPKLRVMLVTAHVPLMKLRDIITIGKISDTLDMAHEACAKLGVPEPRIAVCGLNPHAGEDGLLGDEESRLIGPAIAVARERGIDARGPYPADTVFNAAVAGKFDIVVAMYHDQGLIPVKLLAFDSAVNATIGLPTVRTSPDHGTAFDIAWQNKADAGSMKAAVRLATSLAVSNLSAAAR